MYKKRLTAFIDILGFSQLVQEIDIQESNGEERFNSILTLLKELKSREKPENANEAIEITAFSDSIVISVANSKKALFTVLWNVAWLQSSLMKSGYLCRGGISFGELHHKDGIVFGKGLIEAYKIESSLAVYPRIVVSDEIQEKCNGSLKDVFLVESDDGLSHVDPFSVGDFIGTSDDAADGNDLTEWFYMSLEKTCETEIERLKELKQINPLMKWQWACSQIKQSKADYLTDKKCKMDRFLHSREQ
ncbi:hypothetical protein [Hydrogenovibrio sp. SC-1]|uniref:hypothetical protein n=1 Tax=Hydrogenovibrio sp. SC-1 TaxID=2065820 RepID=UPI00117A3FD2|nr:hypothetical protein [Hydrogenovibrio sp. SC-1]